MPEITPQITGEIDKTKNIKIEVKHDLTDRLKKIVQEGGLLNHIRGEN